MANLMKPGAKTKKKPPNQSTNYTKKRQIKKNENGVNRGKAGTKKNQAARPKAAGAGAASATTAASKSKKRNPSKSKLNGKGPASNKKKRS